MPVGGAAQAAELIQKGFRKTLMRRRAANALANFRAAPPTPAPARAALQQPGQRVKHAPARPPPSPAYFGSPKVDPSRELPVPPRSSPLGAVQQAKAELVFACNASGEARGRPELCPIARAPKMKAGGPVALPALLRGNGKAPPPRPALLPMPALRGLPKHPRGPRYHPVSAAIMAIS